MMTFDKRKILFVRLCMGLAVALSLIAPVSVSAQVKTSTENMALIPAGMYTVGAPDSDYFASEDAKPLHRVQFDAYYIDWYEVPVREYKKCVAAEKCAEPASFDSQTRTNYYSDAYAHFPVVNVTWEDAKNYCEFVGKRLPTEAEWERAAMGLDGYRKYPWGNLLPRPYQANTTGVPGDTEIPNGYPAGNSPTGLSNMMDNVSEWVSDWYDARYYAVSPLKNPSGPESGSEKVIRGGSFASNIVKEHLTNRYHMDPKESAPTIGFRCAMTAPAPSVYESVLEPTADPNLSYGFVQSGQTEGIFILRNPGIDQTIECIAPNGALLNVYEGPIEKDYTFWIRVSTKSGCAGWTLASSVLTLD